VNDLRSFSGAESVCGIKQDAACNGMWNKYAAMVCGISTLELFVE
jgi:hypothetical protein